MHDRFYGIRVCLSLIGGARRGNRALNTPVPKDGPVVNSHELEINENSHELLGLAFPTPNLADKNQTRKLSFPT